MGLPYSKIALQNPRDPDEGGPAAAPTTVVPADQAQDPYALAAQGLANEIKSNIVGHVFTFDHGRIHQSGMGSQVMVRQRSQDVSIIEVKVRRTALGVVSYSNCLVN